jgi:RNA polymerase sigma factor (sigma-70 family)
MNHQDQKYIDALIHNNVPILEELYQRFSDKIKWMVLQNNGSEADAGDIFQDALLCIYRRARVGAFILTCPFEAFLYTICKRRWLKELAKRKQQWVTIGSKKEYNIGENSFKLAEEIEKDEARNYLFTQKLEELGENCRKLLRMNWSGRSLEEVAKAMNISYGYARKKKSLCMEKLIMLIKQSAAFETLK